MCVFKRKHFFLETSETMQMKEKKIIYFKDVSGQDICT